MSLFAACFPDAAVDDELDPLVPSTSTSVAGAPGALGYLMGWRGASGFGSASTADEVAASCSDQIKGRVIFITGIVHKSRAARRGARSPSLLFVCPEHWYSKQHDYHPAGGTSPIAVSAAQALYRHGAHVVLGCRDAARGEAAASAIRAAANAGGQLTLLPACDLSTLAGAERCAAEFSSLRLPLHALVNAAAASEPHFALTADGFEAHFAVGYLCHHLLTQLLLDKLIASAEKAGRPGTVVHVTCSSHYVSHWPRATTASAARYHGVEGPAAAAAFAPLRAAGQAKLALLLHARELGRQARGAALPLAVNAVHPGITARGLSRFGGGSTTDAATPAAPDAGGDVDGVENSQPPQPASSSSSSSSWLQSIKEGVAAGLAAGGLLKSEQQAAAGVVFAAVHPFMSRVSGQYVADCNVAQPSPSACDGHAAKLLYQFAAHSIASRLPHLAPLLLTPLGGAAPPAAAVTADAAAPTPTAPLLGTPQLSDSK